MKLFALLKKGQLKLRDDGVFLFVVVLCTLLVVVLVNFPNHRNNIRLFQTRQNLASSVGELQCQNTLLENEIISLRTDRYYLEALARKKFLLVAPGETVVLPSLPK
jgi:cell division protein FtsB